MEYGTGALVILLHGYPEYWYSWRHQISALAAAGFRVECRGAMRLIACVTEPAPVQRILLHIGEPATPPPISPARSPPDQAVFDWDSNSTNDSEQGEPAPEFEFDQTVSW